MEEHAIDIGSVLLKELTLLDCEPFDSKDELFHFMAERFEETGIVSDKAAYIKALEEREAIGSTYMGDFIAIPHGQCEEVLKPGVGFIRCRESFDYESFEEKGPVKYIFVLAVSSSHKVDQHLRILATLAGYLMKDEFCELIEKAQSYEEIINGIHRIESQE